MIPYRVRMWFPPEVRIISTHVRPSTARVYRDIRKSIEVPPSLTRRKVRPGSVWGVTMVRNEIDTIGHVVQHMFEQGVDELIVSDNASDDGTLDAVRDLSATLPIHVVRDPIRLYVQSAKMTVLSRLAARAGAEWIVPFDADELWFARGGTVADHLRASSADVVRADIHNVFPHETDDADQPDVFRRLRTIDRSAFPVHKVAFRTGRMFKVAEGNLDVTRRGARGDGLYIAHYPWRSFDQLVGKLRRGRQAAEGTDPSLLVHWRAAGQWSDARLHAAWADLLAGVAVDELSWSPVGKLVTASPGEWKSWQLEP